VSLPLSASRRSLVALAALVLGITAASTWWAGRHEAQIGRQVAALAKPGDIRMLSSDTCGLCVVARKWLQQHAVAFSECSIERDAACRAAFEVSRSPGTPVLLVRRQTQVGFNAERLQAALQPH
jgi:glutaredoxin